MTRLFAALLVAATVLGVGAGRGDAEELVTTELVFERPAKMKRIRATVFLTLEDPTVRGGASEVSDALRCGVKGWDRKGTLVATGRLELRLFARGRGGEPERWRSESLVATLDEQGSALFPGRDIEELLEAARIEDVEPELFRLDFAGGRGGRLLSLTLDCRRTPAEEEE